MYELAAESDGEVVRPKEPNWTAWANEVRLMVMQDGRTHKQICSLFKRANKDSFWCKTYSARRSFGKNGMSCR